MGEIEFVVDDVIINNHHAKSIAPIYGRAFALIERVKLNNPTGIEAAGEVEKEGVAHAYRFGQLLDALGSDKAERFAEAMGWPSREALLDYLVNGARLGSLDS